jgi:secondary thiamine-phosphate synthase enzyme
MLTSEHCAQTMTHSKNITLHTKGFSDIVNITPQVTGILKDSGIRDGIVCVFVHGSTASITTIEFEPALAADFRDLLQRLAPDNKPTRHGDTWGDDNGFSHLRASLMGPGISVPVVNGSMALGTWQQIVLVDHDNRPRERTVVVQVVGE